MFALKVSLTLLFRNFKVSTNFKLEEIEFEFINILKIKQDNLVQLEKRNISWQ